MAPVVMGCVKIGSARLQTMYDAKHSNSESKLRPECMPVTRVPHKQAPKISFVFFKEGK